MFLCSRPAAGDTAGELQTRNERNQKTLDDVNKRIERAVQRLESEGEEIKSIGEKMAADAGESVKSADKDRADASVLNDRITELRGEVAEAQVDGDTDRMNRLNSEANDLHTRSSRLIASADSSGPAMDEQKARSQEIIVKGERLKQLASDARANTNMNTN